MVAGVRGVEVPGSALRPECTVARSVDAQEAAGLHRAPEADRCQLTAQHTPETTAESAHKEKNARYPATHKAAVETIQLRPLGRVGKERLTEIEAIAADAAMIRGDESAAPNVVRRIRQAMEYTLITGCGDRAG